MSLKLSFQLVLEQLCKWGFSVVALQKCPTAQPCLP